MKRIKKCYTTFHLALLACFAFYCVAAKRFKPVLDLKSTGDVISLNIFNTTLMPFDTTGLLLFVEQLLDFLTNGPHFPTVSSV